MWATRACFCSGDAESSRLQLKLEERELEKRVKSWKTLAVHFSFKYSSSISACHRLF